MQLCFDFLLISCFFLCWLSISANIFSHFSSFFTKSVKNIFSPLLSKIPKSIFPSFHQKYFSSFFSKKHFVFIFSKKNVKNIFIFSYIGLFLFSFKNKFESFSFSGWSHTRPLAWIPIGFDLPSNLPEDPSVLRPLPLSPYSARQTKYWMCSLIWWRF